MSEPNQVEILVAKSIEFVEHAETFAAEQAPLVVQEIITRGYLSAAFGVLMYASLLAIFVWSMRFSYKRVKSCNAGNEEGWVILSVLFGLFSIGFVVGVFCNVYSLFTVIYCPRIYVLEQLIKLVT